MTEVKFGRGRRALVVDDEQMVADLVARLLEEAGFLVMTLGSSAEAAIVLRTTRTPPDVLITDHSMPHLSGSELIALARSCFPGLPIVRITGWATDRFSEDAGVPADVVTLHKPFTNDELLRTVRALVPGAHA